MKIKPAALSLFTCFIWCNTLFAQNLSTKVYGKFTFKYPTNLSLNETEVADFLQFSDTLTTNDTILWLREVGFYKVEKPSELTLDSIYKNLKNPDEFELVLAGCEDFYRMQNIENHPTIVNTTRCSERQYNQFESDYVNWKFIEKGYLINISLTLKPLSNFKKNYTIEIMLRDLLKFDQIQQMGIFYTLTP